MPLDLLQERVEAWLKDQAAKGRAWMKENERRKAAAL
jgi:hypothetical protein